MKTLKIDVMIMGGGKIPMHAQLSVQFPLQA